MDYGTVHRWAKGLLGASILSLAVAASACSSSDSRDPLAGDPNADHSAVSDASTGPLLDVLSPRYVAEVDVPRLREEVTTGPYTTLLFDVASTSEGDVPPSLRLPGDPGDLSFAEALGSDGRPSAFFGVDRQVYAVLNERRSDVVAVDGVPYELSFAFSLDGDDVTFYGVTGATFDTALRELRDVVGLGDMTDADLTWAVLEELAATPPGAGRGGGSPDSILGRRAAALAADDPLTAWERAPVDDRPYTLSDTPEGALAGAEPVSVALSVVGTYAEGTTISLVSSQGVVLGVILDAGANDTTAGYEVVTPPDDVAWNVVVAVDGSDKTVIGQVPAAHREPGQVHVEVAGSDLSSGPLSVDEYADLTES